MDCREHISTAKTSHVKILACMAGKMLKTLPAARKREDATYNVARDVQGQADHKTMRLM